MNRHAINLVVLVLAGTIVTLTEWGVGKSWAQATTVPDPGTKIEGPAVPVPTQPAPPKRELKIESSLWQILPEQVRMVYVGPDGRLWWELEGTENAATSTIDQIKAGIEKEFASQEPKVVGARPALFEKTGRVWFITQDGTTLLGYAGTPGQWLQRQGDSPANQQLAYEGSAMTPGWSSLSGYNLEFDHKRFFVFGSQICMFDGVAWTQQAVEGNKTPVRLLPEPDGKGILALALGAERPVWRYAPGEGWSPLALPKDWTAKTIVSLAPLGDGQAWVRTDRWSLRLVKLDGPDKTIASLGEVEEDGFKPTGIGSIWRTQEGSTFVSARDLLRGDQSAGAGVLHRKPDASMEVIRGEPLYVQTAPGSDPYQAVAIRSGRALLLPGRDDRGAAVVDLKDGKVESAPAMGYQMVVAYQRGSSGQTGRIFLAGRGSDGKPLLPLAVWQPGQPDKRATVQMEKIDARSTAWAIANDGSLITQSKENVIERLEGQTWQVVTDRLKVSQVQAMAVMGPSEILAAVGFRDWSLVFEDRVYTEPGLKDLIAQYASDFVAIFRSQAVACGDMNQHQMAVDKEGHIWLINGRGMVQVLVNGKWIDALDQYRVGASAGGDATAGQDQPLALAVLGDGQYVYMQPKIGELAAKRGVVGRVSDGQVQCWPAPGGGEISFDQGKPVRDGQRGLWVSQAQPLRGVAGVRTRWSAGVVDGQGKFTPQSSAGRPILLDKSGCLWLLRQVMNSGQAKMQVWKEGKIWQELDVPAGEDACWVSDKPGSVWAWTTAGLHHFVAAPEGAQGPGYKLEKVLHPVDEQGVMPKPRRLGAVTGGWLVLGHQPAGFRTTASLYLVPTEPKK